MYAHTTTCRGAEPARLLHSEAEVARVLTDPSTEPSWAAEARIPARGLTRYLAAAAQGCGHSAGQRTPDMPEGAPHAGNASGMYQVDADYQRPPVT